MEAIKRFLAVLAGVTALTGAAGTIFYDNPLAKQVLAIVVGLAVIAALFLPKLGRILLRRYSAFAVKVVDSAAGVRDVVRCGRAAYTQMRKAYPDEKLPLGWWAVFPSGIVRIVDRSDTMWMYLSIWPISETAFHKLRKGMPESDLKPKDICRPQQAPFHFFYIADICRTKRLKRANNKVTDYIRHHMIAGYFDLMIRKGYIPKHSSIEYIAHPVSMAGRDQLRELGFTKIDEVSECDVYYRCITSKTVNQLIASSMKTMEANYAPALAAAAHD